MSELYPSVREELAHVRRPFVDRDFSFSLCASLLFHAAFLLASFLMPPTASGLNIDMNQDDHRYARYLIEASAIEPPPFLLDGDKGEAGSEPAPGDRGMAGKPDTSARSKRRSIQGQETTSSQPPQATREAAATAGIIGVLGATLPSDVAGVFDPNTIAGDDARTYLGQLFGNELGDSAGFGGLHMRDAGRSGGGDVLGSVGLDRLGTQGDRPGVGIGYGKPGGPLGRRKGVQLPRADGSAQVHGSLSKEVIRRTIARHLAEVRFCYEQGLVSRPDLMGRVQVGFIISASGAVQSAHVVQSDLSAPVVEACIRDAVRRWAFPQPEQGGLVSVTYPFVLQATE